AHSPILMRQFVQPMGRLHQQTHQDGKRLNRVVMPILKWLVPADLPSHVVAGPPKASAAFRQPRSHLSVSRRPWLTSTRLASSHVRTRGSFGAAAAIAVATNSANTIECVAPRRPHG